MVLMTIEVRGFAEHGIFLACAEKPAKIKLKTQSLYSVKCHTDYILDTYSELIL